MSLSSSSGTNVQSPHEGLWHWAPVFWTKSCHGGVVDEARCRCEQERGRLIPHELLQAAGGQGCYSSLSIASVAGVPSPLEDLKQCFPVVWVGSYRDGGVDGARCGRN